MNYNLSSITLPMEIISSIQRLGQYVLDLVFPVSCLVCGQDNTFLCVQCQAKLPRLTEQQCLVCQTPSPFGKTHANCGTRVSIDGAIAGLTYQDRNVQKIIEVFKYNFVSDLSILLSNFMIEGINNQRLSDYFQDFTVVAVPLHIRRFHWRGFNQAQLLADKLAVSLNLHTDENLVRRQKSTQPQTKLTAQQRKQNMDNAFSIVGDVINKKILLVDDVVTSGSTANELAKILKRAGAEEVWLATVAHG